MVPAGFAFRAHAVEAAEDRRIPAEVLMVSFYANIFQAEQTEEEIALLFGQRLPGPAGIEQKARMLRRMVLSTSSAKRLHILLDAAVRDYEGRYGLSADAPRAQGVRRETAAAAEPQPSPAVRGEKA